MVDQKKSINSLITDDSLLKETFGIGPNCCYQLIWNANMNTKSFQQGWDNSNNNNDDNN